MCDYSLHAIASRVAKVGDELVTTKFANTFTRGFAAIGEPNTAVCLAAGTELVFKTEAERDHPFAGLLSRLRPRKVGAKVARFRKINVDRPDVHHDALEFANGKIVLLTRLRPGQCATVLQLPVRSDAAADAAVEREQLFAPMQAHAGERI